MSTAGLLAAIIVVGIVLIMFTTNIPSLIVSREPGKGAIAVRTKSNQASVIMALRAVHSAESTYSVSNGGLFGTFSDLRESGTLDRTWTDQPVKSGHSFTLVTTASKLGYCVNAKRSPASSDDESYSMSQQGTIYHISADEAPVCDPNTGVISTGAVLGN